MNDIKQKIMMSLKSFKQYFSIVFRNIVYRLLAIFIIIALFLFINLFTILAFLILIITFPIDLFGIDYKKYIKIKFKNNFHW